MPEFYIGRHNGRSSLLAKLIEENNELREELEMWQKIAKRLELALENDGLDLDIDWARKEVEKDVP